ncbi:unnamed protein product [Acanthoscelides obtectus]|uniref:Uncharacterized protein n=1 Tax=Acanthoscelides obtectus TaxID=200917 RepID=A0A9P0Q6V6_ACAOB|nr:unnamed protein product [Acanthoscelides obtectus]CAK1640846.1 hypothetical protein AOBTE_LOCUS11963 [Acanthoscelides obtectus]
MENYLQYKMSTVRARMNPDIAPHKFACQLGRQLSSTKRVFSEKRARQKDIAKYFQERSCVKISQLEVIRSYRYPLKAMCDAEDNILCIYIWYVMFTYTQIQFVRI